MSRRSWVVQDRSPSGSAGVLGQLAAGSAGNQPERSVWLEPEPSACHPALEKDSRARALDGVPRRGPVVVVRRPTDDLHVGGATKTGEAGVTPCCHPLAGNPLHVLFCALPDRDGLAVIDAGDANPSAGHGREAQGSSSGGRTRSTRSDLGREARPGRLSPSDRGSGDQHGGHAQSPTSNTFVVMRRVLSVLSTIGQQSANSDGQASPSRCRKACLNHRARQRVARSRSIARSTSSRFLASFIHVGSLPAKPFDLPILSHG